MRKVTDRSITMFRDWHLSSAVRSRPYVYKFSEADFSQSEPGLWFPAALSPVLAHDSLKAFSKQELRALHVYHLVYFMDYTTELEIAHVNEAVQCIVIGGLKKYFEDGERCIALKLYADEGYHALFSRDIAGQVARHFDLMRAKSTRIMGLDRILEKSPLEFRCLTRFCIAFVSETLIASELLKLSRGSLVGPVAHMFIDHLHDEGRHAIFFSECFVRLWRKISVCEKNYVVQVLLEVLAVFCRPDIPFLQMLFEGRPVIGNEIVVYLESNWSARMLEVSGPTLRAIQRTDLLDDEGYLLQFKMAGLVA
ncbi:diiron oxygenase [Pseudomonas sp. C5pp]|uniref:diiron oxygenase n=1 Tax=Pseudomonas sp. C5pp TaxID=1586081 RepID=UPI0009E60764|nr:diiron oxygenase [Pseudomonas sp. C5pp]